MEWSLYLFVIIAYFFSAFVKGVAGLGFSTTCLGMLAIVLGVKEALPLVIWPAMIGHLVIMRGAGHFQETVQRFWLLLIAVIPGMILGLWALSGFNSAQSSAVLGIILVLYSIFALLQPQLRLPEKLEKPLSAPVGFTTGIVNGMTGSQVMPVLPFLLSLNMDNNRFVQAINCSFSLSSIVMAVGLMHIGYMSMRDIVISTSGLFFVFLGVYAGRYVRNRLKPDVFRRVVLILLLVLGANILLTKGIQ